MIIHHLSLRTVSQNNSAKSGGGIYIEGADATISNTLINNNTAKYGGGIFISGSVLICQYDYK